MASSKHPADPKAAEAEVNYLTDSVRRFVEEAEKTGASLAEEVKQLFDDLTEKVTEIASSAAETTVSVAEKVSVKEPAELFRGLLEEVRQASEVSMQTIGDGFANLRRQVLAPKDEALTTKGSKKKVAKKKTTKKKVAKKKVSKKKVTKKKVSTRKTTAKKAPARKTAVRKKVTKKTTSRKTAPRKKTSAKKAAS